MIIRGGARTYPLSAIDSASYTEGLVRGGVRLLLSGNEIRFTDLERNRTRGG